VEQRTATEILAAGPHAPSQARRLLTRALDSWQRSDLTERAVLAVSELVTNAFLYGTGDVVVDVTLGTTLRVEVRDNGVGVPTQRNYSPTSVTGRGLHLVGHMADRWGSDALGTGKVVWFEIDTAGGEPAPTPGGIQVDLSGLGAPPPTAGRREPAPEVRARAAA